MFKKQTSDSDFAVNVDLSFFKTESLSVGVQLRYDQNTKQHLVPMAFD